MWQNFQLLKRRFCPKVSNLCLFYSSLYFQDKKPEYNQNILPIFRNPIFIAILEPGCCISSCQMECKEINPVSVIDQKYNSDSYKIQSLRDPNQIYADVINISFSFYAFYKKCFHYPLTY